MHGMKEFRRESRNSNSARVPRCGAGWLGALPRLALAGALPHLPRLRRVSAVCVSLTGIKLQFSPAEVSYGYVLHLLRGMGVSYEFILNEAGRIAWVSGSIPWSDRSCLCARSWYHPRAEGRCPLVPHQLHSTRRIIHRTGVSVIICAVDLREW